MEQQPGIRSSEMAYTDTDSGVVILYSIPEPGTLVGTKVRIILS